MPNALLVEIAGIGRKAEIAHAWRRNGHVIGGVISTKAQRADDSGIGITIGVAVGHPDITEIDERTDLADRRIPALGQQEVGGRVEGLGLVIIGSAHFAGNLRVLDVERPTRTQIDQAGKPWLYEIGRARFVDLQTCGHASREILQMQYTIISREEFPSVEGRVHVRKSTDKHHTRLVIIA